MKEYHRNITVSYGDGIGPEIMEAVIKILKAAGANLSFETIEIGEKAYNQGYSSGITPQAMETVKKNQVLLKAPITTPQGKGYKSLNVTFRKTLELYANIRPVKTFKGVVSSAHDINMVIFRENEEDLYSGIEYRITKNTAFGIKLVTKAGCEKIIRKAFEYATNHGRKKVTCFSKDNIMKITDGIFHNIFRQVAEEYSDIEANHMIVDIGSARIASRPQDFDVLVTMNLYGDIISDIAAEVAGSVGLCGSANVGAKYSMFEAIHGSAPDIAGLDIANPSGLISAACMMLEHIGHYNTANLVQHAMERTIASGIHTQDIYREDTSKQLVGTKGFADAVIENLANIVSIKSDKGEEKKSSILVEDSITPYRHEQKLVGVDVYIGVEIGDTVEGIVTKIKSIEPQASLKLQNISENGLEIWPSAVYEDSKSEMLRLRFIAKENIMSYGDIMDLLNLLTNNAKLCIALNINLYTYDDMAGFTKAQGE
jgi:isocitrate dehydrogenase